MVSISKGFALGLAILVGVIATADRADAIRREIDTEGMATISIDVQSAQVASVLRMFSEFANVNIISGPEVDGTITVRLEDVPWLLAFDWTLRTNGFGWDEADGIYRVSTMEKLQNEALNEQVMERKREDFLPLETAIINVNYANADEMKKPLEVLLSNRGEIETDERTNALVVTDIFNRIEGVREMASVLDFKTPQVEINAKLVDVDARHVRDLGINWSVLGLNSGDANADIFVDAPIGNPAGTIDVGIAGDDADFDAVLQMLESDNRARIISNPRITTADNKAATIVVGKKVPLVVADEAGNAVTELTTIGIKMTVKPHVNRDDRVTLDLSPEVSDLSSQATVQGGIIIVTSQADTRVIVGDGETAVIGGLIRQNESTAESGIPVLKNIPVLGYLFKSQNKTYEERELLIFVTPRVLKADEA